MFAPRWDGGGVVAEAKRRGRVARDEVQLGDREATQVAVPTIEGRVDAEATKAIRM